MRAAWREGGGAQLREAAGHSRRPTNRRLGGPPPFLPRTHVELQGARGVDGRHLHPLLQLLPGCRPAREQRLGERLDRHAGLGLGPGRLCRRQVAVLLQVAGVRRVEVPPVSRRAAAGAADAALEEHKPMVGVGSRPTARGGGLGGGGSVRLLSLLVPLGADRAAAYAVSTLLEGGKGRQGAPGSAAPSCRTDNPPEHPA